MYPFAKIRKLPNRLAQKLKINVYILSEKDPQGIPFSMMYVGNEGNKNYLANVIFGDNYKTIETSKIWVWNLRKKIDRKGQLCNLLILEDTEIVRRFIDTKEMFVLPVWIGWKTDISGDISAIVKQDRSLQSDMRRIRKNNLTFEVTNDETDFEEFYQQMYIPYITSVHGDQASLTTYDDMKNHFAECDLIIVGKDKEKMGGMLIRYENEMPRLWSIGVTDARVDYLKAGVIGALYYFSVIHLKEQGHDTVHYGATRAFLNDGVLRYKKKWGIQVANQPKNVFFIRVESVSPKLKAIFMKNPFIHMKEGTLQGAIFIDSTEPPSDSEIQRFGKDYFLEGLSGLTLYLFGYEKQGLEAYDPQKQSDKISVRPAGVFFK
jgi:hypothetical protein